MLRVVILINPDSQPSLEEPKSLEIQQLKGLESRLTAHIRKSYCFQEISIHSDRNSDLKAFSQIPHEAHTLCIASGEEGLCALNFMSKQLEKKIHRKQWGLIWVGVNYIDMLASPASKIDFVVFPHWKESKVIHKLQLIPKNFRLIFDFIGIYSDMRRDYSCFTPNEEQLPTLSLDENAKLIGFILGGHYNGHILPRDLIEHWLKTICEHALSKNESLHFILMDSPVTLELPDKGDGIRNIAIKALEAFSIPYTFIGCEENIEEEHLGNHDPLSKIPMVLNWIESRSGDLFVTGDNIGDIYNILGCTQSIQSPYVHILMPKKPSNSNIIDQEFYNYYKDEWHDAKFDDTPWMIISKHINYDSRAFDDELLIKIDEYLATKVNLEEVPELSFMARICNKLSSLTMFKKPNQPYASVELSETRHEKRIGEEVTNPLNPTFTIE